MKLPYKILYITWAALFALTAVLGFLFPDVSGLWPRLGLMALSVLFFLSPWMILSKARKESNKTHIRLIRYLSIASIVLTAGLLCANLMSIGMGPVLGSALNAALIIVSAPMVCSNFFVLPLFLWGSLLMSTFGKR